ncbi:MAG: hypothetical protein A2W90_02475 [Bacteroidetes bacterium GWF2_42_66]|nr:MAG: hypothetical protein A2W92_16235 [Bacteroidetes bacterium GWA2_42_15]OFY01216.1 MAG: hypothetical protein A2W89_15960 [Bacteroidetes bacterium GWE2_42_39]OFY42059.1 MAG: hypothetical protein A2W90_02475 [Bacteroidetes bacterium GWF2_42_66]HBL77738.1 hypothetical protein [Prolixibacteraceae bacterium]HCB62867.1 hypothetical protein [Bacteroidales bacterium]
MSKRKTRVLYGSCLKLAILTRIKACIIAFIMPSFSIGYIKVTTENGSIIRINSRSILRYTPYENMFLENTKTRLWYLDGHFENIREKSSDIDLQIASLNADKI